MGAQHDLVLAMIRQVFPERDEQEILTTLEAYGNEPHESEKHRVHRAILKLSDEEQRPDPSHYVKLVKQDFRDVLAWVEYPNQMRCELRENPVKSTEIARQDAAQYQAWLDKTQSTTRR
jgi:hypothetical protein